MDENMKNREALNQLFSYTYLINSNGRNVNRKLTESILVTDFLANCSFFGVWADVSQNMGITKNEKFVSVYLATNCSWTINITEFAIQKVDLLTSQLNLCGNVTSPRVPETKPPSVDAVMYIIIVLMFYTFSIVVLMVKYIHREKQEAQLFEYYHEFVAHKKVKLPLYQNKAVLQTLLSETNQKLPLVNKNSLYLEDGAKDRYAKKETSV